MRQKDKDTGWQREGRRVCCRPLESQVMVEDAGGRRRGRRHLQKRILCFVTWPAPSSCESPAVAAFPPRETCFLQGSELAPDAVQVASPKPDGSSSPGCPFSRETQIQTPSMEGGGRKEDNSVRREHPGTSSSSSSSSSTIIAILYEKCLVCPST